ncbi:hypothetical protein RCH09_000484 [Actimicrobium sp. GrIS 1.19]|uniref:hypothetical protein n=1 Tax=Actimicrobium sp. GrIS 1.19 TaxID=3071708 RepID=UPI002DF85CE8|nr:hypothetical protein [Actimicrobium sp. GrIS 1.19]
MFSTAAAVRPPVARDDSFRAAPQTWQEAAAALATPAVPAIRLVPRPGLLQRTLQQDATRARDTSSLADTALAPATREQAVAALRALPATPRSPLALEIEAVFKSHAMVRGFTDSPELHRAVDAMAASGQITLPYFHGFAENPQLQPREQRNLAALRALQDALPIPAKIVVILADAHAEHNEIPPEIHVPYYQSVQQHAAGLGLETRHLSEMLATLAVTPEQIAAHGRSVIQVPKENDPARRTIPGSVSAGLKKQAGALCSRFPSVFEPKHAGLSGKARERMIENKAKEYMYFRAGEEAMLLNRLPELFGPGVIAAHVADPNSAGLLGVKGLYLKAPNDDGELVNGVPWGANTRPLAATGAAESNTTEAAPAEKKGQQRKATKQQAGAGESEAKPLTAKQLEKRRRAEEWQAKRQQAKAQSPERSAAAVPAAAPPAPAAALAEALAPPAAPQLPAVNVSQEEEGATCRPCDIGCTTS